MKNGPVHSTSQEKSPAHLTQHAEVVCQPIVASSPTTARSPLLPERLMMCFEEELRNYDNSENTGLFHRPTKKTDSVNCKSDTVLLTAASSLDVDGDSEDSEDLQKFERFDERNHLTSSLPQYKECVAAKSELSGCESPFMTLHCSSDHKAKVASGSSNLTSDSLECINPGDEQFESKQSPKLQHKAVTRVKSMMSTEAANMSQQQKSSVDEPSTVLATTQPSSHAQQCETDPRITERCLASHQPCKKGEASEVFNVPTINTVTLWRHEDESFGLNVEIMSSPLKVIITGLKPGGAAERVRLIGFIFIAVQYQ